MVESPGWQRLSEWYKCSMFKLVDGVSKNVDIKCHDESDRFFLILHISQEVTQECTNCNWIIFILTEEATKHNSSGTFVFTSRENL